MDGAWSVSSIVKNSLTYYYWTTLDIPSQLILLSFIFCHYLSLGIATVVYPWAIVAINGVAVGVGVLSYLQLFLHL